MAADDVIDRAGQHDLPYDFAGGPEVLAFPPAALDGIRDERPFFRSTFYGGFWVFTRYADIRAIFQDHDTFVQQRTIPPIHFDRVHIPLGLNEPEHSVYRRAMMALFSARQMASLEEPIRLVARRQLALFHPTGRIEFASDFALTISAAMFCRQLGLPVDEFPFFHRLSHDLIYRAVMVAREEGHEAGQAVRTRAGKEIEEFLIDVLRERRMRPGEDVLSLLMSAQVYERALTEDEIINIASLLFFAGTDSTAGAISYAHMFLAQHPDHRRTLVARIEDAAFVAKAGEELLRYHGFHHIARRVTKDVDVAGASLKEGDLVILPVASGNRDWRRYDDPLSVDFERGNANTHLTFGAGVHRCIGSHLAVLELRIALQEVHRLIPDYWLAEPVQYQSAGQKIAPSRLVLAFEPG